LAALAGLSLGLGGPAQVRAEPLVSQARRELPAGAIAGFGVAPAESRPNPVQAAHSASCRKPRRRPVDELREMLLREYGVSATLFFGYFLLPSEGNTGGTPAVRPRIPTAVFPPITAITPPPPPPSIPVPKTTVSPRAVPDTLRPTSTPEPATLLSGLLGAGLASVVAWRRRRKAARIADQG
jgi:hypothetical protein